MYILICNAGSTSLKFKLFDMPQETVLAEAKVERIGTKGKGIFTYKNTLTDEKIFKDAADIPTYSEGIEMFLSCLLSFDEKVGALKDITEIERVGFKTVLAPGYGIAEIDDDVENKMREFLDVAPAHNGPYLEAINLFKKMLPQAKLVGAFETAFHETIPPERTIYSVPYEWYEKFGLKKMGYHGASHSYVAETVEKAFSSTLKMISCHLGGSGSICAIENGKSVDTSFGLSLQTGTCHANRCGDVDPYIFPFLEKRGLTRSQILEGLEKNGGLLGISGISNDMRDLRLASESGSERASLAISAYETGIIKYIGAFYAELKGLDYLVFTGGIGENDASLRSSVCENLSHLGIKLSDAPERITERITKISSYDSKVTVLVIPANEELGVARKTYLTK